MFKMWTAVLFLFSTMTATIFASATKISRCNIGEVSNSIQVNITGCTIPPCLLKRGNWISIEEHFTSPRNSSTLTANVYAKIFLLPLPFYGVDGTDASDSIYKTDNTKADFPLISGKEYIYRYKFEIMRQYPLISPTVYWSLVDAEGTATCFTIPIKITS